jgi:hypothetical protein
MLAKFITVAKNNPKSRENTCCVMDFPFAVLDSLIIAKDNVAFSITSYINIENI